MRDDSDRPKRYRREEEGYEKFIEKEQEERREEHKKREKEIKATAYFDVRELPEPKNNYVCWLDVMGVKQDMLISLHRSANNIFKLHSSVLKAKRRASYEIDLYPVMDGVFVVSPMKNHIRNYLTEVFETLARTVLKQSKPIYHVFAARAAIAYGPVIHGKNIPDGADLEIAREQWYKESILLGNPMIQAVQSESQAPPFGIYVDESARSVSTEYETSFNRIWYRWFYPKGREKFYPTEKGRKFERLAKGIGYKLDQYFKWCENNHYMFDNYQIESIRKHREMADQYFLDRD